MSHRHKLSEDEIASLKNLGREVCTIVAYAARRSDKSTVRWTPINPGGADDPVDLYVGECAVNDTLTFMCGVTRVRDTTIEQIAALLNAEADHAAAFHAAFYGDLSSYGKLHTIRPCTPQFPRHAMTIKTATMPSPSRAVAPREFVYLEAQEDIMDTARKTRGWVCAMHSIDMRTYTSSADAVRGRLFRSGIVLTETQEDNVVEVTYLLQIDFSGPVPMDIRRRMMGLRLHSLRFIGDHFRNSQHIPMRRIRSSSSTPAMIDLKRSTSGRCCSCCGSKFHLLQRKYTCRICNDIFCSHCGNQQRVMPGGEKISICHTCIVKERMGDKALQPKLSLDIPMNTGHFQQPAESSRSSYHSGLFREKSHHSMISSVAPSSVPFNGLGYEDTRQRPPRDHGFTGHRSSSRYSNDKEGTSSREGTVVNLGDLGNASDYLANLIGNRPSAPTSQPKHQQESVKDIIEPSIESSQLTEDYCDDDSEWRGQVGPIAHNRTSGVVMDLRDLKNASEVLSTLDVAPQAPLFKPALPQLSMTPANPVDDDDVPPETRHLYSRYLPTLTENEDGVQFRGYGPPCVARETTFDFSIWAFGVELSEFIDEIDVSKAKSTIALRRGALVHAIIEVPDGFDIVKIPIEPLTWLGEATCVTFQIHATNDAKVGQVDIKATVVVGENVIVIHSFFFVTSNHGETFEVKELRQEVEKLPLEHKEIPFHDLRLRNLLAHCHSGYSYRAEYEGQEVVVRMVRPNQFGETDEEVMKEFQREASVLTMFGYHPHIVPFVGASTDIGQPLSLVTEFLPDGNLENHFNKQDRLSLKQKNQILCDAAMGLLNIHEGGFVHRDVAARNCLVDSNLRGKICDFGMCRRVNSPDGGHFDDGGMGPLKYMAPESLQPPHIFSFRSDSYSFGVMMWETFTEAKPFSSLSGAEAAAWVMEGGRLDHISDIPVEHRDMIAQCFQEDPSKRPSMADIVAHFRTLPSNHP